MFLYQNQKYVMRKKAIIISGLICCSLVWNAFSQVSYQSNLPESWFERGKQMFETRNYVGCIDQLTRFKTLSKNVYLIQEADFMLAASAYYREDPLAIQMLQNFVRRYPGAGRVAEAEFMSGNYYFFSKKYRQALKYYKKLKIEDLVPSEQEKFLFRTGVSYLKNGQIGEAKPCFVALLAVGKEYKNAAQFYMAYIQYTEEKYDDALKGFLQVQDFPEFRTPASYYIAQIRFFNGQYLQVIQTGEKLLSENPDNEFNTELYRLLGESYSHQGDNSKTINYLTKYVNSTNSPLRSSLYTLGVAQYREGKYADAIKQLSWVTDREDGLMQSAYLYLGQSYIKIGDKKNAAISFDIASQYNFDRQIQEAALYNYALTIHETSLSPFGESVTVFEKFLNMFPASRYADQINDYLVEVYFNTHNYQAALTSINKIKQPDSKILKAKQRIYFQLGTECFTNSQIDKAIQNFTQAIALGNYDSEIKAQSCFWRGESRYRKGEYDKAASDYRAYLSTTAKKDKDIYALARYDLAYANFKQHKFIQALDEFRRYVSIPSASVNKEVLADAYNRIGDCHYYMREFAQAENDYSQSASLNPAAGDYALFQKAFMAGLQKKYEQKISGMNRLVSDYPRSEYVDDAIFEKGLTYLQLKNSDAAIQSFNQVIREFPQSPIARKSGIQLGMIYFNNNQLEQSIMAYKTVVSNYPGSEEARIAVDDLKSVYLEKNDIGSYASFVQSLNGAVPYQVSEIDSLTYLAAERSFMKKPDKSSSESLIKYLQSFPDGAFTTQAHYYLGLYYFDNKQYEDAWRELTAVRQHNDNPFEEDAVAKMAKIKYLTQEYAEALNLYKTLEGKATSGDNRLEARLGAMRSAQYIKNYVEIIVAADNLLSDAKLSPELVNEARFARAMAHLQNGQAINAVPDLQLLSKDLRTVYGAEASYRLAQYYFDNGDSKDAEHLINEMIETGTPHQYWLAREFILLADINISRKDNFQAKQYLLSLKNNYNADDDIAEMIEQRLKQIGQ